MKTTLLSVFLAFATICSLAQSASVTGKWKIIRIYDNESANIDFRDKEGSNKKMMDMARAKDADFTQEDSMMVVFAAKMLTEIFTDATMEFKADGSYEFVTQMQMGGKKREPEKGTYKVDHTAKTITTTVQNRPASVQYFQLKEGLLHLTSKRDGKKELTMVLEKAE